MQLVKTSNSQAIPASAIAARDDAHRLGCPAKRHRARHEMEARRMLLDEMARQRRDQIAFGELRQRHHEIRYCQRHTPRMSLFGEPDIDDPQRITDDTRRCCAFT